MQDIASFYPLIPETDTVNKTRLEEIGLTVESLTVQYKEERFHKGPGFCEEIRELFLDRLRRSLDLIRFC